MIKPRCPHCDAQGLKHLSIQKVSSFTLVYCGNCGAIHGIIPTAPPSPKQAPEAPGTVKSDKTLLSGDGLHAFLAAVGNADLHAKKPLTASQLQAKINAMRAPSGSRYLRVAGYEGPPLCHEHKTDLIEFIVPEGYKNAGVKLWVCPHYSDCHCWQVAD